MKTLELGKFRLARIWIGELPDTACPSVKTFTQTVSAGRESQNGLRLAAIEIFVPLGPRSMYGLLGGEFKPDSTHHLNVDVLTSATNERLFDNSLAAKNDEVRVGLPTEYAQAVLAGVNLVKNELNTLMAGNLSIHCAAHGTLGSSESVYKNLAVILIKLLNANDFELSENDLVKLFPTELSTMQIYTQVSIRKLKEIYTLTHPARLDRHWSREWPWPRRRSRLPSQTGFCGGSGGWPHWHRSGRVLQCCQIFTTVKS